MNNVNQKEKITLSKRDKASVFWRYTVMEITYTIMKHNKPLY